MSTSALHARTHMNMGMYPTKYTYKMTKQENSVLVFTFLPFKKSF